MNGFGNMQGGPMQAMTWAALSAISPVGLAGRVVRLTDAFFTSAALAKSDGTNWLSASPWEHVYTGPSLPCPANTNENTLKAITLPGGLPGPNGMINFTVNVLSTNSSNNKTFRMRLNGVVIGSGVVTTTVSNRLTGQMDNVNSLGAQRYFPNMTLTYSALAFPTATIDTSVNQSLTLTLQMALGTESFSIESFLIRVLRGV